MSLGYLRNEGAFVDDTYRAILRAAAAKNAGKIERLFVIGCLSERYADSLRAELPEVDGFFGARTCKVDIRESCLLW